METRTSGKSGLIRIVAKCLALIWGGFWAFFVYAVMMSQGASLVDVLRHGFWFGPLPLILALIALRWERVGRILLTLAGVTWSIVYPLDYTASSEAIVFLLLGLPVPALVSGIMLLLSSRKPKEIAE